MRFLFSFFQLASVQFISRKRVLEMTEKKKNLPDLSSVTHTYFTFKIKNSKKSGIEKVLD